MVDARDNSPSPAAVRAESRPRRLWSFLTKWARVGLAGLAFLGFWMGAVVLAFVVFPVCHLVRWRAPRFERAAACQVWLQLTFTFLHDYMRWCGLLHFNPRDVQAGVPASGFVLVANHPTLVDVAALSGVFGRLTCVAKTPLFRSPVIGHILRACGYLDGGGGDPFSGGQVVDQGVERVSAGMPVLIFPEGSRSPPGALHPFKRGAFEIACRSNAPILALTIRCTPPALGKGRPWYDIPRQTAIFTVTPLAVLWPSDFQHDSADMMATCQELYRRDLGLIETRTNRRLQVPLGA